MRHRGSNPPQQLYDDEGGLAGRILKTGTEGTREQGTRNNVDKARGILMVAVGAFVLYRGFVMRGPHAWLALGLGVAAIALGIWRLTRKPPQRLV